MQTLVIHNIYTNRFKSVYIIEKEQGDHNEENTQVISKSCNDGIFVLILILWLFQHISVMKWLAVNLGSFPG